MRCWSTYAGVFTLQVRAHAKGDRAAPLRAAVLRRRDRLACRDERGSAAVEYVGLALVISMLMTAIGSAIDSATGDRVARALIERLVQAIQG